MAKPLLDTMRTRKTIISARFILQPQFFINITHAADGDGEKIFKRQPDSFASSNLIPVGAAGVEIERERTPEVQEIQRLQAFPPRVVLSRAWWGEPVRRLAAALAHIGYVGRLTDVKRPDVLLCAEPTGALDQETGHQILDLFNELHEAGNTLVLVTHDEAIGAFSPRCIRILDGRIESQ